MHLESVGFTHPGGVRKHNEDAFLEVPEAGLWVVADGMGGYQAGDIASQLTCDTVAGEIRQAGSALAPKHLEQSLHLANERIRQYARDALDDQMVGSTVVALLIQAGHYHLYWAGDSRCYLARGTKVRQLSRDHSQVAEMVEQGMISPAHAEHHPLAHIITRALGVDDTLILDYQTGAVEAEDVFILCSDGISKEFNCEVLAGFVNGGKIRDASLAMMHSALVNECNDNITCVIVNVIVNADSDWYIDDQDALNGDQTIQVYPGSCNGL